MRALRRWLFTPNPLTLTCTLLFAFLLCTFQYFKIIAYRDPTSYFFDSARAYEKLYSKKRIQEARAFIDLVETDPNIKVATGIGIPQLCIGVATVSRRGDQYVNLTVGSLLAGLDHEARRSIFLSVLVGHTDPSRHPDSRKTWMQNLPDQVLNYDVKSPDYAKIQHWENEGWYRNKTIYDYTLLLRDCYKKGAKYVLMIEDDVIAAQGWFSRTMDALGEVETKMQSRSDEKWIYLRLFYVEDLLGWNSEEWPRYLFWSFVVWLSGTCAIIMARNRSRHMREYCSDMMVIVISAVFVPAAIALHFIAGRQNLWPLSPGVHEMNKYGCCSQSLVFPRHVIPDLLRRTDLSTDWLVDMMIEQIANQEGWIRWATVPALFQHIGITSSKGYGFDDSAKKLWNFRFEEQT